MPKSVPFYCHKDQNPVSEIFRLLLELTSMERFFSFLFRAKTKGGRELRSMRQARMHFIAEIILLLKAQCRGAVDSFFVACEKDLYGLQSWISHQIPGILTHLILLQSQTCQQDSKGNCPSQNTYLSPILP